MQFPFAWLGFPPGDRNPQPGESPGCRGVSPAGRIDEERPSGLLRCVMYRCPPRGPGEGQADKHVERPGAPFAPLRAARRAMTELRGEGKVFCRPRVDRHRCESPAWRRKVVGVSARSLALGSTRVGYAPSTGPAVSRGEISGWLAWSNEAFGVPAEGGRAPWGESGGSACMRPRPAHVTAARAFVLEIPAFLQELLKP
jgi:hypothetical protein